MTGATIIRQPVCIDCNLTLPVVRDGRNFNRSWAEAIKHEIKRQGWSTAPRCFDCSNKTRARIPGLHFKRKEIIR